VRYVWLLPALLILAAPLSTGAQQQTFVDSVLVFGPTYLFASFDISNEVHIAGDSVTLSGYGVVSEARPPIVPPTNGEITFTLSDLEFSRSFLWDKDDYGGLAQQFKNGTFRLFQDDSPDASLSELNTYSDGTLLLEGSIIHLDTGLRDCYFCPGRNSAEIEFTGGSLFSQVSRNGVGYTASFNHLVAGVPVDSTVIAYGYQVPGTGSLGLFIPVSAERTTWGKIKRLYH
jgi:hypothetical protein